LHKVLDAQVDFIITDSPFIMGITYMQDCSYKDEFSALTFALNRTYKTLNFFIERNHKYQEYGRIQTSEEADEKSKEIKKLLDDNGIEYITLKSGEEFINKALEMIL